MAADGIRKGARLRWPDAPHHEITVKRVAKDGSWADIFVYDRRTRTSWTKRQPLGRITLEVLS